MPAFRLLPNALRPLLAAVLLVALSAPIAVAASDPPVAAFTVSVADGDATFTDASTNDPTEWHWDFGDGSSSADQSPVHHYDPGTYTVTLVATNDAGSDSVHHDVTVTAAAERIYALNLYGGPVRYQDPDRTACVATAALIMLNEIATAGTGGDGFRWARTSSYATQKAMLAWSRNHDTLEPGIGTDANGWRNTLNQYGWGAFRDADTMTYQVFTFRTYDGAVKAAIQAMARYHKPVGILGWAGGHAQVLNGYNVSGKDPTKSDAFRVRFVYLTDPLRRDAMRNTRLNDPHFRTGSLKYRFRAYAFRDSPYDDPFTPGISAAWRGWYGRWVIVAPVR